jgi:hypothetical protein
MRTGATEAGVMPARPRHCIGQKRPLVLTTDRCAIGKVSGSARSQETTFVRATISTLGGGLVALTVSNLKT